MHAKRDRNMTAVGKGHPVGKLLRFLSGMAMLGARGER